LDLVGHCDFCCCGRDWVWKGRRDCPGGGFSRWGCPLEFRDQAAGQRDVFTRSQIGQEASVLCRGKFGWTGVARGEKWLVRSAD
jgi:hypothetical protein